MERLIRTDRNGTKYYEDDRCPKCGGTGFIHGYQHVEGGRCFLCGGSGIHYHTWKEYTPEYAEKLANKRRAKAQAKSEEVNKQFLKKMGFNEDGKAWVVLGNTYEIKDELKEAGAKFGAGLGWHFDHEDNGYESFEIDIMEVACKSEFDFTLFMKADWMVDEIIKAKKAELAPKTSSEYIGEIGQKLEVEAKLVGIYQYESHYTYYGELNTILKFEVNGNTLVWKTSSYQDVEEGKTYKVKGTVKAHEEYRGDKQTVLTRCKIA